MSIATNPSLSAFYRWLHRQPLPENPNARYTQHRLADDACTGRTHLSMVLTGKRKGHHTWRRIVRVLPPEGLSLLRHCPAWNNLAERHYQTRLLDLQRTTTIPTKP